MISSSASNLTSVLGLCPSRSRSIIQSTIQMFIFLCAVCVLLILITIKNVSWNILPLSSRRWKMFFFYYEGGNSCITKVKVKRRDRAWRCSSVRQLRRRSVRDARLGPEEDDQREGGVSSARGRWRLHVQHVWAAQSRCRLVVPEGEAGVGVWGWGLWGGVVEVTEGEEGWGGVRRGDWGCGSEDFEGVWWRWLRVRRGDCGLGGGTGEACPPPPVGPLWQGMCPPLCHRVPSECLTLPRLSPAVGPLWQGVAPHRPREGSRLRPSDPDLERVRRTRLPEGALPHVWHQGEDGGGRGSSLQGELHGHHHRHPTAVVTATTPGG